MRLSTRTFAKTVALGIATAVLMGTVASATEPTQDPAANAATLDKQAADLRATAAKHESMAKAHRGGAGSPKMNHEGMARHCDEIAKNLRAAAKESEELAAEYRKDAAK